MDQKDKGCAYWIAVLVTGLALGAVAGFVLGWLWGDRPNYLSNIRLLDVLIAFGTVGAVMFSLINLANQSAKDKLQKRNEALINLAYQYHQIELARSKLIGRNSKSFDSQSVARDCQEAVIELLDPRHDLADKNFNRLIAECGGLLSYAETRADDGESIVETLNSINSKLKEARGICVDCWRKLGFYWITGKVSSVSALHEVPPKNLSFHKNHPVRPI